MRLIGDTYQIVNGACARHGRDWAGRAGYAARSICVRRRAAVTSCRSSAGAAGAAGDTGTHRDTPGAAECQPRDRRPGPDRPPGDAQIQMSQRPQKLMRFSVGILRRPFLSHLN